ncbi:hypothetical protein RRG08_040307 [Elysia crispata]|uniref:Uncharacterized protein n=1 Tax=Elysia crispata TaxID=231223 RepID=A0AAE1D8X9_9GAST|nr:hypothetical protein RRG08_040307 [Elysia crispata]
MKTEEIATFLYNSTEDRETWRDIEQRRRLPENLAMLTVCGEGRIKGFCLSVRSLLTLEGARFGGKSMLGLCSNRFHMGEGINANLRLAQ